ncbi:MAG TPA: hypothetical protein VL171_00900 [Verrucomicrobiae bacterium]|nr:hypothetical protein [Verrucomicrobiae bacterium]
MVEHINEAVRRFLKEIATKGGKAGTGKAKVRGNKAYYKRLSARAAKARKAKAARQKANR